MAARGEAARLVHPKSETTKRSAPESDEAWFVDRAAELGRLTRKALADELSVVVHCVNSGTCDERLVADALRGIADRVSVATEIGDRWWDRYLGVGEEEA